MRKAAVHIVQCMQDRGVSFEDYTGLTQTINQAARAFQTNFGNNIWMRHGDRQTKLLTWQLKLLFPNLTSHSAFGYLRNHVASLINQSKPPEVARYKDAEHIRAQVLPQLQGAGVAQLVAGHQSHLPVVPPDPEYGIQCSKTNWSEFVPYALYCAQTMEIMRDNLARQEPRPRLPRLIQIVPQYGMRVRYLDFGVEQQTELFRRLVRLKRLPPHIHYANIFTRSKADIKDHDEQKKLETWQKQHDEALQALSDMYKQEEKQAEKVAAACSQQRDVLTRRWQNKESQRRKRKVSYESKIEKTQQKRHKLLHTRANRTNSSRLLNVNTLEGATLEMWRHAAQQGILAKLVFSCPRRLQQRWTYVVGTDGVTAVWHIRAKKAAAPGVEGQVHNLPTRGYMGHAGELSWDIPTPDIIAIDPGHVNLIDAVRLHSSLDVALPNKQDFGDTRKERRRYQLAESLARRQRSTFQLRNTTWRAMCGRLSQQRRVKCMRDMLGLQQVDEMMSHAERRSVRLDRYLARADALLSASRVYTSYMI